MAETWLSSLISSQCRGSNLLQQTEYCKKLNKTVLASILSALLIINLMIHYRNFNTNTDAMTKGAILVNTTVALILVWLFL
jgi:predicted HAD superfamily hydrolase